MSALKKIGETKADDKGRVPLTKIIKKHLHQLGLSELPFSEFDVFVENGRLILEPQVRVPAKEAWLFKNKEALNSIQKGLEEVALGKISELDEDFTQDV